MRESRQDAKSAKKKEDRNHHNLGGLGALAALLFLTTPASADDDTGALFATGSKALHEGRANDAVAAFEALADRGVVDATASYDRGLAYAARVRVGAEQPGDLGRAAHGFEEARDLTRDARLEDDATRALGVVRAEIVRRRTRAGESIEVDAGRSLGRTVARLLTEDAWALIAAVGSAVFGLGLFSRWFGRARRVRVASGIASAVAVPALVVAIAMTLASRHDRRHLVEAVVVSPAARPVDDRGIALVGAAPLPEGARVELIESRGALARVRLGSADAWVSAAAVRTLARAD